MSVLVYGKIGKLVFFQQYVCRSYVWVKQVVYRDIVWQTKHLTILYVCA